jgi:hypothetical protein
MLDWNTLVPVAIEISRNFLGISQMSVKTPQLLLLTTLGCCLCDHAKAVLWQAQSMVAFEFCEQDIALSDELIATYGLRIPVVKSELSGFELDWPFTAKAIEKLVRTVGQ